MPVSASTSATSTSGIDVNSIVTQLMQVESRPLQAMQAKQSALQAKISAFGSLKSAYSAIGDAAAKLEAPNAFKAVSTSSSDPATVSATAAPGTGSGSYSIQVTQLAQSQKLASGAFAALDSPVGTGTLNIQFGTFATGSFTANGEKAALSVAIGAGQNSLTGVRDAINRAGAGIRASIVNDGTGFRLAMTSTDSGVANSLRITVADDDANHLDNAGLSQLAYDPAGTAGAGRNLEQKSAALDANLSIDGLAVVKSGNTITDALPGVTLTLSKLTTGTPVTVSVSPDASSVKNALDALVASFNSFQSSVRNLTGFNAATKTGGLLSGDAAARGLLVSLKSALGAAIPGLTGNPSNLAQIGLSFQKNGALALDPAKFNASFADPNANMARLFAAVGIASDTRIQYAGATSATPAGSYAVGVTQAASRGGLVGAGAANLVISSGVNDLLGISVNGTSASITLAPGAYTADSLAAEVQSRLNGAASMRAANVSVSVSQAGGILSLTSNAYGSASRVSGANGNAAAGLFGVTPAETIGVDVAGTIGGVAAIGSGRNLKATSGLAVTVSSSSIGSHGSVDFNRGYASKLGALVASALDINGAFASRSDGLNRSIKDSQAQQERFTTRLTQVEAGMRRQYTALDGMLSSMNTTSTYLTQQITAMQAQSK